MRLLERQVRMAPREARDQKGAGGCAEDVLRRPRGRRSLQGTWAARAVYPSPTTRRFPSPPWMREAGL